MLKRTKSTIGKISDNLIFLLFSRFWIINYESCKLKREAKSKSLYGYNFCQIKRKYKYFYGSSLFLTFVNIFSSKWSNIIVSIIVIHNIALFSHNINAVTIAATSIFASDDLLIARCQSACLFNLEQRHRNNTDVRRKLRHQIMTICRNDQICSSCILPCNAETILRNDECLKNACKDATDFSSCKQSCSFVENAYYNKPGVCPPINGVNNLECSASCDSDGDCTETQKCCSSGCSRICRTPIIDDNRILPIPESITVQERKRKRSAIVRWIMKRLSPAHVATNANIFVVQWRWSLHQYGINEKIMPWQTITMHNKMYVILKHVLAPGRYYNFRIAAVNIHGSYGFSNASHPAFKLSRNVKAPTAPTNLSIVALFRDLLTNDIIPTIAWQAPRSDLPLKDYHLTWWKISKNSAIYFKRRPRHQNSEKSGKEQIEERELDYEGQENVNDLNVADAIELLPLSPQTSGTRRRVGYGISTIADTKSQEELHTMLLPSYSNHTELRPFSVGQEYIVELYASIESSDGELRGEPAILHIPANITNEFQIKDENNSLKLSKKTMQEITVTAMAISPRTTINSLAKETSYSKIVEQEIYKRNYDEMNNHMPASVLLPQKDAESPTFLLQGATQKFFGVGVENSGIIDDSTKDTDENLNEHQGVELKTPYFEVHGLKTALSWIHHPACTNMTMRETREKMISQFRVRIRSNGECINELPPQEFHVNFCVANFENLQFECQYIVEVSIISTGQSITKMKFTTAPCHQTPSATKIKCPIRPPKPNYVTPSSNIMPTSTNDIPSKQELQAIKSTSAANSFTTTPAYVIVVCKPLSALSADCNWRSNSLLLDTEKTTNTSKVGLIGYRIILNLDEEKNVRNNQRAFVTVVGAEERRIHLQSLIPNTSYNFRVQPITVHGLGTDLFQTHFKTPAITNSSALMSQEAESLQKLEIPTNIKQRRIHGELMRKSEGLVHDIDLERESGPEIIIDALSLFTNAGIFNRYNIILMHFALFFVIV